MRDIFANQDADLELFYSEVLEKLEGNKNPIVEEAELLLGCKFDKNTSTLTFNPYDNTATPKKPYERKLLETDVFRITHWAGEFWKVDETPESENYGVTPYSYPEPEVFVGKSGTFTEVQAMEALYSGDLSLFRGRTAIIKEYPMRSLLYAPERQTSDATYYNTTNNNHYQRLYIQPCIGGKGTMKFEITLSKTKAELMELLVGNLKADGTAVASQSNHFILRLRGFRAVGKSEEFEKFRKKHMEALGIRE